MHKDIDNMDFNNIVKNLTSQNFIKIKNKKYQLDYPLRDKWINDFIKYFHVKTLNRMGASNNPMMFYFRNGYYQLGVEDVLKKLSYKTLNTFWKQHIYIDILQIIQAKTVVKNNYFYNFNPNYLNVKNGTIELFKNKKDKFEVKFNKHNPTYKQTTIFPINYKPKIEYKFFEEFVVDITNKPKTIQRMFGYCLYKGYPYEVIFFLQGSGANGKTQLLQCLIDILGQDLVCSVTLQKLVEDQYAMAHLHNKFANIVGDNPGKTLSSTAELKHLTDQTPIHANAKFKPEFHFVNYAKIIFALNDLPKVNELDGAFWRRVVLIEFPRTFRDDEQIPDYAKRHLTETEIKRSAIFNYALDGLIDLLNRDHFDKDEAEVKRWMREMRMSEIERKIFSFLVRNPNKYFNKKEVAFATKTTPEVARRHLAKLTSIEGMSVVADTSKVTHKYCYKVD